MAADFKEEDSKMSFDLRNVDMVGPDKTNRSCYSEVQSGISFNVSSWARFDNFSFPANFTVELTFRTASRDGILFLITGKSTSKPDDRMNLSLHQSNGQLILTYKSTKNESQVIWTEPGLGDKSMSSYLMCQMKWHTVLVTKQGRNITIILDKHLASSGGLKGKANCGQRNE
ncbi:PREDICTED: uncharacterized protein LOC107330044 [Acropora digitifera]|uniref:uncharacterized protein LOC107330044 n=1 Tax=Acropora digitifera TaxID=70779 RepID=UPI00077B0AF9|nr:PREDICTED: uncharacterized protein LOC107330044 [Acropora digitifera]